MRFPKVLIITGEPFNAKSATGITLSNLFRGWPKDSITQIYSANIQPDPEICTKNWKISTHDLLFIKQLSGFRKKSTTQYLSAANANTIRKNNEKLLNGVMRRILTPLIDLLPYQLPNTILTKINEFKPDVIYSLLGNIRLINLVDSLSERYSIPVVPHFMDDWLSTYSVNGRSMLTAIQRIIINRLTCRLMKKAPMGFSIGDAMAQEYSQRFSIPFFAFMNPVFMSPLNNNKDSSLNTSIKFIYIGGFHLGRHENLVEIGSAIAEGRRQGLDVTLTIYAPKADLEKYKDVILNDGVEICGTIPPEDVQQALSQMDVAIHVESFLERYSCYTRLSVSTKIPQYYAAGLPVLAYGPNNLASCKYVHDYSCGINVGVKNMDTLVEAIRQLALDSDLRDKLAKKSRRVAIERHDAIKEQERFRSKLAEVAFQQRVGS